MREKIIVQSSHKHVKTRSREKEIRGWWLGTFRCKKKHVNKNLALIPLPELLHFLTKYSQTPIMVKMCYIMRVSVCLCVVLVCS
jgi:hypothetical protein